MSDSTPPAKGPAGTGTTLTFVVGATHTARAVGSGDLDVLATPQLLAWCEAATCAAVADSVDPGRTTVGVAVEMEHLAPSAIGRGVEVTAVVADRSERRITFDVEARQDDEVIGRGTITRAVVDRDHFLARMHPPQTP